MTKEKFLKYKFNSYMRINFSHRGTATECMLIGIDFDEGIMKLLPFSNDYLEEQEIYVSCEHCEVARYKLKKT